MNQDNMCHYFQSIRVYNILLKKNNAIKRYRNVNFEYFEAICLGLQFLFTLTVRSPTADD